MEEICLIDNIDNIDNIRKRKVTFQQVIQNKKRKLNNEIITLTHNLNRLKLKRKAEDDNDEEYIKKKKIKISNNDNIINYDNLFIPIENNLKRKIDVSDELDKLDGINKLTKKIKLKEEIIKEIKGEKEEKNNILNCNCLHICRCDYDYEYFKESNTKLPPNDLIYRYIN
jgi:hypothetical protein